MGNHHYSLSGTALTPAPYESALCSLWRLGWRNCLNSAQLRALCSSKVAYPAQDCSRSLDWIDGDKLRSACGWTLPSEAEHRFSRAVGKDREAWICESLRFCPLCLELGYHSFLCQLNSLERCPLHEIPLVMQCQSCGCRMPGSRFAPAVFDRPYMCKCGQPYSGVPANLILDETLRNQSDDIERSYGEVMQWWESSSGRRALFARFWNPQATDSNHMGQWCDVPAFIRSLSLVDAPYPDSFYKPRYGRICQIEWRVRISEDKGHRPFWLRTRSWQERVKTPTAVYRTILRRLQRWIMREHDWTEDQFRKSVTFHSRRIVDYSPRLLALLCLRSEFEDRLWEHHPWDPRRAQLRDEPAVELIQAHQRTPRLAWRAVFLALYANWYSRILKSKDKTLDTLAFFERHEKANGLLWNEIQRQGDESFWIGSVAFPRIDALQSLFPNPTRRLGVQAANEVALEHPGNVIPLRGGGAMPDTAFPESPAGDNLADDSIEAYLTWLGNPRSKRLNPARAGDAVQRKLGSTAKAYELELERFLCWCQVQFQKTPLQMTASECSGFAQFLARPEPREFWMSELGRNIFGNQWHRFRGPLSGNSIQRALHIINGYYRFLQNSGRRSGWLQLETTPQNGGWAASPTRTLSPAAWELLCDILSKRPSSLRNSRLELSLRMLYETGMRISELVIAKTSDLQAMQRVSSDLEQESLAIWHLRIRNARRIERKVKLPPMIDSLLRDQLARRGFSDKFESLLGQEIPLIGGPLSQKRTDTPEIPLQYSTVSAAAIRDQLLAFFVECSRELIEVNPTMAAEISKITPGSLRNAHISRSLSAKADAQEVGKQLGLTDLDRVSRFKKKDVWTCLSSADVYRESQAFFATLGSGDAD